MTKIEFSLAEIKLLRQAVVTESDSLDDRLAQCLDRPFPDESYIKELEARISALNTFYRKLKTD